ncbi:MAG: hypothetical protein IJV87_10630 [Clostridia bacterium]|nr:hypothetical protein [Clostridia bacterium]
MDKQKLVNEIQYFQMYLSTIISNLRLNDAICDFYENDTKSFNRYGICLGNISDALNYRQHMLCYLLFFDDKESKSIPRFLRRVQDTKIVSDKAIDLGLTMICIFDILILGNTSGEPSLRRRVRETCLQFSSSDYQYSLSKFSIGTLMVLTAASKVCRVENFSFSNTTIPQARGKVQKTNC